MMSNMRIRQIIDLVEGLGSTPLYHGTSTASLAGIQTRGLLPKASHDNPDRTGIYLTDDPHTADTYAVLAADRRGGKPVTLVIDPASIDASKLEPDDWDLQNAIDDLHDGEREGLIGDLTGQAVDERLRPYREWKDVPWELSLAVTNQVVYSAHIPPSAIA